MSDFPFDGLDLTPTNEQAKLIAAAKELISNNDLPAPDVIQPRPGNTGAIELFWVEQKLCVVFESEKEMESMAALGTTAEAA